MNTENPAGPMSFSRYASGYDLMARNNPAYQSNLELFRSYLRQVNLPVAASVCDIGAGTGNFILAMHQLFDRASYTHIDADQQMNRIAKEKYDQAGVEEVEIIEDYFQRIEVKAESFDLIICTNALYTIQPADIALQKIATMVKPDGHVFIIDFGRKQSVLDWGWYLTQSMIKRLGLIDAAKEIVKFGPVIRENANTTRGQVGGDYWTHSTEEFQSALTKAGLTVTKSETCYRGYADLAWCVKSDRYSEHQDAGREVPSAPQSMK